MTELDCSASSANVAGLRRDHCHPRTTARIRLSASPLTAGRKLVKRRPCWLCASLGRNVKPRNVNCTCGYAFYGCCPCSTRSSTSPDAWPAHIRPAVKQWLASRPSPVPPCGSEPPHHRRSVQRDIADQGERVALDLSPDRSSEIPQCPVGGNQNPSFIQPTVRVLEQFVERERFRGILVHPCHASRSAHWSWPIDFKPKYPQAQIRWS